MVATTVATLRAPGGGDRPRLLSFFAAGVHWRPLATDLRVSESTRGRKAEPSASCQRGGRNRQRCPSREPAAFSAALLTQCLPVFPKTSELEAPGIGFSE